MELGTHHIKDGEDGEVRRIRDARFGVDGGGPGGAVAAAEDVRADDEEGVGVERLAGANEFFPPALCAVRGRRCGMGGRGEPGMKEDNIVPCRREGTPGLVSNVEGGER